VGYPLEERLHRGFSGGCCWWRHAGQPLLDRTLQSGFDIFAGQAGKPLGKLIELGYSWATHQRRERLQYTIIRGRDHSRFGNLIDTSGTAEPCTTVVGSRTSRSFLAFT